MFRINGVVHHRIGSLLPNEGDPAQYAQLYIHDTSNEVQNRLGIYSSESAHDDMPDPEIVESLIAMLDECNPLVKQFRMARETIPPIYFFSSFFSFLLKLQVQLFTLFLPQFIDFNVFLPVLG